MARVALARDPQGTHKLPHGGLKCSARRTFTKPRLHPPDSSEISTVMQGKHWSGQTFHFLCVETQQPIADLIWSDICHLKQCGVNERTTRDEHFCQVVQNYF